MTSDLLEMFPHSSAYTSQIELSSQTFEATREYQYFSERHLQCVWYDPRLRPRNLKTHLGEPLKVEHPGHWNLEAGPDFTDAVLLAGAEERRISGDVEIHIAPDGWRRHAHANDPRYRRVCLHVTFFKGLDTKALFPPNTLHVSLRKPLLRQTGFHFENIDLKAYPYGVPSEETPCKSELSQWGAEQKTRLLESAGEERLRHRAKCLKHAVCTQGSKQIFYEEILASLGYKQNQAAFRELARAVPLERLRSEVRDWPEAYAILLGVAGLLPKTLAKGWSRETRDFIRSLWGIWFREEEKWDRTRLGRDDWQLSSLRPTNNPARRLMAAAQWFGSAETIREDLFVERDADGDLFVPRALRILTRAEESYWSYHLGWSSQRRDKPTALIGRGRATAILLNLLIPWLATSGNRIIFERGILRKIPAEPINGVIRQTAHQLFGRDHPPALYKSGLARQGLIQIFQDHCLSCKSGCATCQFPELLRAYRKDHL